MKRIIILIMVAVLIAFFNGCITKDKTKELLVKAVPEATSHTLKEIVDAEYLTVTNGYEIFGAVSPEKTVSLMKNAKSEKVEFMVCTTNGTVWQSFGKPSYRDGCGKVTGNIFVEVYPQNYFSKAISECEKTEKLIIDRIKALENSKYYINGEIKSLNEDSLLLYGTAIPVYSGNENSIGVHYTECAILVKNPDKTKNQMNYYYTEGTHYYLGTTTGTNAYGGEITVYVYGDSQEIIDQRDKFANNSTIMNTIKDKLMALSK